MKRRCEVCGVETDRPCTNGRCPPCHQVYCGSGGSTSPGHGRGKVVTPFAEGEWVAVKPRKGQWFVSLKREKLYGKVTVLHGDGTFDWQPVRDAVSLVPFHEKHIVESREHWEDVQYDVSELRFVDVIPPGFTVKGNDWKKPERASALLRPQRRRRIGG